MMVTGLSNPTMLSIIEQQDSLIADDCRVLLCQPSPMPNCSVVGGTGNAKAVLVNENSD